MCVIRPKIVAETIKETLKIPIFVNAENWKIEKIPQNMPQHQEHIFVSKFTYKSSKAMIKPKNNLKNLKILVKIHFLTKLQFLRKNIKYWKK